MSSSRLGEKEPAPLDLRRPTCAWNVAGKSRLSISTVVFVDGIRTPKCRVMCGLLKRSGTQGEQRRTGDDPVGDAAQALDLVLRHEPRAEGGCGVFALGRAQAHLHLVALHVARAPVVEQAEADHVIGGVLRVEVVAVAPDDDPDLALEVEVLAA